ncbi:MAG TPA: undecaprenyldiphospho-muramoylpentapeptide beta-N-acetylglucosaminyltransferase [Verrucomicrobiae bacterium]|nr:undecaprenyldiphospho-muramoylpentapeptide beta-N-acetylglucosaminyltransferase [Verrucomicrobiae bacterium]
MARSVMIMAGGTGGHVYPALAVAHELRRRGHDVTWMGAPASFEARVVPAQGFAIDFIRVSGLRGKGVMTLLQAPLLLARALLDAWRVLRARSPAVVLGMGGFAAGPGGLVARLRGVPLVIHEQNAAAGLTNRCLARIAQRVLEAFPRTFARATTVGNPVRAAIRAVPAPEARLAGRTSAPRILVVGGSQGAKALNERMASALALLAQKPEVRHQGGRTVDVARAAYERADVRAEIIPFIEDMAEAFAWADLVVCRAGASTIAELAAAGCASVLVPFPAAVDDHQTRNAEYLVRAQAALLLPEAEFTAQRMADLLSPLLGDRARLVRMAQAARGCAWTGAEVTIADAVADAARG